MAWLVRCSWIPLFGVVALLGCSRPTDSAKEDETTARSTPRAVAEPKEGPPLRTLQLPFIENRGQVDPEVGYYTRVSGGQLCLTRSGKLVLSLRSNDGGDTKPRVIEETLVGARDIDAVGRKAVATRVNSFVGSDPKKSRSS